MEEVELNSDEKHKKKISEHKMKVLKELCPGTNGKFPCFLRRRRSPHKYEDLAIGRNLLK